MTTTEIIRQGQNGNATIVLYDDGTRIIDYDGELDIEYPLNVDLRVSGRCRFGLDERTKKSVCDFCHESATTNGPRGNLDALFDKLQALPRTTEVAIGINEITPELIFFLENMKEAGFVVNGTINQGLIQTGEHVALQGLFYGTGISYRSRKWNIDDPIYREPNTVMHVIAGIDDIEEVLWLAENVCTKILVLGEKDFGFNSGRVNMQSDNHRAWYRGIQKLFKIATVSFDNLAIEQLNIRRFFRDDNWAVFFQGEHSIYINAVTGKFQPSSRSLLAQDWNEVTLAEYFRTKIEN